MAELNAASDNALVKTYTWGPDVSGSLGGAGGNGGVLIMKDHRSTVNESFYPAYDAQGNVTGLIDTSSNLDAAYEYDPFGKLIRYAGARSSSMSLLYGTKYTDMETGLIYYGHRYYDPRQGRFINRDPIGEEGGVNLYGFVGNNPVNGLDFLGLWTYYYYPLDDDEDGSEDDEETYLYELEPYLVEDDPLDPDYEANEQFLDEVAENFQDESYTIVVVRGDDSGDGGSGGGGSGDGGNNSLGEEEEDNEKTDCEKFVDSLVSDYVAQANASISDGNSSLGYHLGSNWLSIRSTTLSSWSGFRPELTAGGQNGAVSRHIYGHAGVMLMGSLTYGPLVSYVNQGIDYLQRFDDSKTVEESRAEIAGDRAGRAVADAVSKTAGGLLDWSGSYPNIKSIYNASRIESSAKSLRQELTDILCQ